MTKFYAYNIQLLPDTNEISEVGKSGYKKLFREFRIISDEHKKLKTLEDYHRNISGDIFFGPDEFYIKESYVYGYFIKYIRTNEVTNLNSGKTVFKNKSNATRRCCINPV